MSRRISRGATWSLSFSAVFVTWALSSLVNADTFITSVSPPTPTEEETFDLLALRWFEDTGYEEVDQSIDVDGFSIAIESVIQDLHTNPDWVFPQVLTPFGSFFNDFGPLPAGTYDVTANFWLSFWPSTEPVWLYDTTTFSFEVLGLESQGALMGDYNDDGMVDAADYTVWRDHMETSFEMPNDETPGSVTDDDFLVWRSHFGESHGGAGSAAGEAIPEPTSLWLMVVTTCLMAISRRPC